MEINFLIKGFPGKSDRAMLGLSSVVLVKVESKNILIDTGGYGARIFLISELEKLGLKPNDIQMLLITHLHFDHCANIDMFPDAEIVVSRQEWEHANNSNDVFVDKTVIEFMKKYKKRFIERDNETIIKGIETIFTPGHTPGGITYLIHKEDDIIAIAGDAIKNRAELASGNVVMTYDKEISKNSIEKVKKVANKVLPGHDCLMNIDENGEVTCDDNNTITLSFQDGLCVNGSNYITLTIE